MGSDLDFEWGLAHPAILTASDREEIQLRCALAQEKLSAISATDIPAVDILYLANQAPDKITQQQAIGPGLSSPIIEEARKLNVYEDFKYLSDLRRRSTPIDYAGSRQILGISSEANIDVSDRKRQLRRYIEQNYEFSRSNQEVDPSLLGKKHVINHPDKTVREAFNYVEDHWSQLARGASKPDGGTVIPSPYPVIVPAGRFDESYYWDTCFGCEGLLATGRNELARMQADNLLESIRTFGFIPNAQRQYYLSRSQVPLSATLIRKVVVASELEFTQINDNARLDQLRNWVLNRAVPLLEHELINYWRCPETRFDTATKLHRHWDDLLVKRPERHSSDNELTLGKTLRDVRAMAESGLDFTSIYNGKSGLNEISRFAPVLLNSVLTKFATDLSWLASFAGLAKKGHDYSLLATEYSTALNQYLWNDKLGSYRQYHFDDKQLTTASCFTAFAPLFAGACSQERAARVFQDASKLEHSGGIAASDLYDSPHQWDGTNGWAPAQMIAIQGLQNYGYKRDAQRIAHKWVQALANTHQESGCFIERIDVKSCQAPKEYGRGYPVQAGFLWTNASFTWALTTVLGYSVSKSN